MVAGSESSWITKTETKQSLGFFVFVIQRDKFAWERWRTKTKRFLAELKTAFVWVSKKISGPTQQPSGCKSRQLDHKIASCLHLQYLGKCICTISQYI